MEESNVKAAVEVAKKKKKRRRRRKRRFKVNKKSVPNANALESDSEQETIPEKNTKAIFELFDEEEKTADYEEKHENECMLKKQEEKVKSVENQRRHREWLRYYELRHKQFNYHLPEPEGIICWDELSTH